MKNKLKRIKNIFKNVLRIIIRSMQKVLITVFLAVLYVLGFGITLIYLSVFNRKFLKRKSFKEDTWWEKPSGYDIDPKNIIRQS